MNLSITNPLLEKSFNDNSESWKYVWWHLTVLINISTTILYLQNLLKDVTPRLDKYSDVLHVFRRLLPVSMNLFMTIPRLEKSFDDDFSSTNFFWSVLLLLIRLSMTSSRPEKSFKEKVIARSRPQNIFQDGKLSSSSLKNTHRLDKSFYDISSSYKMFRK